MVFELNVASLFQAGFVHGTAGPWCHTQSKIEIAARSQIKQRSPGARFLKIHHIG